MGANASSNQPYLKGSVQKTGPSPSSGASADRKLDVLGILAKTLSSQKESSSPYLSEYLSSRTPLDLTYQPSQTNLTEDQVSPIVYRQITVDQPKSIGSDATSRIAQQRTQVSQQTLQQSHQQTVNLLNTMAVAQGLPTYQEFHHQNGVAYTSPANQGSLGLAKIQADQQSNSANWVPDIQLSAYTSQAHAQHAQSLMSLQAQVQEQQRQAAAAAQQQQWANTHWAKQKAVELQQQYQGTSQKTSSPVLNAQVMYRAQQQEPVDVWHKMRQGASLTDPEMKQLFHTLDLQEYGTQNPAEKQQAQFLRLYAEQKLAKNTVAQAERDSEGNIVLNGTPVRPQDALYFAKLDVQNFEQTDTHLLTKDIIAQINSENSDFNANTAYQYADNTYNPQRVRPYEREVLHLRGIRNYKFPTSSNLSRSSYPDVTNNQSTYINHIVNEVKRKKLNDLDFLLLFPPGGLWDLKGQPGIPKADPMEWAIYKGQLVHDAYLANNVFGHAAAARGMSLEETLDKTDYFYQRTHMGQHDQPEDRSAIISGWWAYHTGSPWPKGLKSPTQWETLKNGKNKNNYREIREHFIEQPEIQKILAISEYVKTLKRSSAR